MSGLADLFLLDPKITFLNHGSYGATPKAVFEIFQDWQRQMEAQPVAFLNAHRDLVPRLNVVRARWAADLGADPADLALMSNATSALNVVAQSLDLREGDEILTSDHEYAALDTTWDYVCRATGARIVRARIPLPLTSEETFTDALLGEITPKTRVLFLSHVTSATALVFPLARILAEARARGILSVIDGAHAPGQVTLDLQALGADFYAGNGHKWLMAPKGTAFLHARSEVQHLLKPPVISHGWTAEGRGAFGNSLMTDALEMQGTRDVTAWLALPAALDFERAHNWTKVRARCQELAQSTARRVQALTGLPALASPEFTAPQMVAMQVPDCDPLALHDRLLADFGIEIPCYRWQDRTIIRLSVQGYNTQDQMDLLVTALTRLLPELA